MIRWMYRLADLLSGRIENTLVSHNHRLRIQEKKVTKNQETINSVAQELSAVSDEFDAGIQALKDEIESGTAPEDLDFSALEAVADKLKSSADALTPAPAGTPSSGDASPDSPNSGVVGGPIVHEDIPPTPLAGASGPTDAGVPTATQAPGAPTPDVPTTPLADDATAEAGNGSSVDTGTAAESDANPTGEGNVGDSSASSPIGTEQTDADAGTQQTGTAASSNADEFDD